MLDKEAHIVWLQLTILFNQHVCLSSFHCQRVWNFSIGPSWKSTADLLLICFRSEIFLAHVFWASVTENKWFFPPQYFCHSLINKSFRIFGGVPRGAVRWRQMQIPEESRKSWLRRVKVKNSCQRWEPLLLKIVFKQPNSVTVYCFNFPRCSEVTQLLAAALKPQGHCRLLFLSHIGSGVDILQGWGRSWWHNLPTMRVVSTQAALRNRPAHCKKENTPQLHRIVNYLCVCVSL